MGDSKNNHSIKSKEIEIFLRKKLDKKDFKMNHPHKKKSHSNIVAKKENLNLYIEVLGYKDSKTYLRKKFFEVIFKAFSHLEDQETKYSIIAMPLEYFYFLKNEISSIKTAWIRICIAFPELRLYFVDTQTKRIIKKKLVEIINDEDEL